MTKNKKIGTILLILPCILFLLDLVVYATNNFVVPRMIPEEYTSYASNPFEYDTLGNSAPPAILTMQILVSIFKFIRFFILLSFPICTILGLYYLFKKNPDIK